MCIICIGVVSVVIEYNCDYYCDTCYIQTYNCTPWRALHIGGGVYGVFMGCVWGVWVYGLVSMCMCVCVYGRTVGR
jgi:hypothetical protein